jgi:hypothetical protein
MARDLLRVTSPMPRARLSTITTVLVAVFSLGTLPGCLTYSAVQHLRDKDRAVPHVPVVFIVGNVLAGAAVGVAASTQVSPDDRAIVFAQEVAVWNMMDLLVGLPLFTLGLFRDVVEK